MDLLKSHDPSAYALEVSSEKIRDLYRHLTCHYPCLVRKTDFDKDIMYLKKGVAHRGIRFFTVDLPKLDDFLVRLLGGTEEPQTPRFLRPAWELISVLACDMHGRQTRRVWEDGDELRWPKCDNDILTIRMVRSILKGFKKFELPPTEEQIDEKVQQFLETEKSVQEFYLPDTMLLFRAQRIMEDFMGGWESKDKYGRKTVHAGYIPSCPRPKHGPGAVADRKKGNEKWCFSTLYDSVHQKWPYYDYFFGIRGSGSRETEVLNPFGGTGTETVVIDKATRVIPTQLLHQARTYRTLNRVPSPTSRLVFVPKDSRGPRTITCEPSEVMWLQQGVLEGLVRYIERHPMTKGHVNFADQTINALRASQGARDNSLATLDLKDASDRVSAALVHFLVPRGISDKWFALRSTHTILPDGSRHELGKFAAMGSALCFPVEALVFWSLCVAALEECGMTRSASCESVYVYGDDIIVPSEHAPAVMDALESVNLVVNRAKSFYGKEFFRESCGTDAFLGHNVTPIIQKALPPSRPSDGNAIKALLDQASLLWTWMPYTAHYLLRVCESVLGQSIPRIAQATELLAVVVPPDEAWRIQDWIATSGLTWDRDNSHLATKALVIKTKRTVSPFAGAWTRLLHSLTTVVLSDPERVVDRSSTQIRRKLVQAPYVVDQRMVG